MIALAVILLLLAAALVVGIVVTGTSQEVLFDSSIGTFTTQPVWIFAAGAVAALLALLGFAALGRGTRRRVARRREMKRLRRVEKEQAAQRRSDEVVEPRDDRAAVPPTERTGYDEPDRHLVREPRTEHYDPQAGEHVLPRTDGHTDSTRAVDGTVDGTAPRHTTRLDEPARHRQP
jgi:hypothetical protein